MGQNLCSSITLKGIVQPENQNGPSGKIGLPDTVSLSAQRVRLYSSVSPWLFSIII